MVGRTGEEVAVSAWRERVEIAGGRAVLYLGDNREIWPALGVRPDAVVTDPPFGIGFAAQPTKWQRAKGFRPQAWDDAAPESVGQFLPDGVTQVVWGGNYFDLPQSRGWLIWHKPDAPPSMGHAEMAWTNIDQVTRLLSVSIGATNAERCGHPTQKPERLMEWCLEQAKVPVCALVADPYMGSGTTGVAAMRRGCRFVGIEIDDGYFRTACRRIGEAARQPDLLIPETAA